VARATKIPLEERVKERGAEVMYRFQSLLLSAHHLLLLKFRRQEKMLEMMLFLLLSKSKRTRNHILVPSILSTRKSLFKTINC